MRSSKRHEKRDQENNAQLFSNKTTVQRVFEEKLNERMSVRISKDKMKKGSSNYDRVKQFRALNFREGSLNV